MEVKDEVPVIGEVWHRIQYPGRTVRILRIMRSMQDNCNLRVVYEYTDYGSLYQDTVEHFTDQFERVK